MNSGTRAKWRGVLEKAETYDFRMELKEAAAEKAAMEAASKAAIADAAKAEAGQEKQPKEAVTADTRENSSGNPPADREAQKEARQMEQRGEKRQASHEKENGASPKKERRSVLARLNEKKEKLKTQPQKDVPHRSKSNELS